jgi:crotonobetainyl-CoA:carnitine CoA-transferase CaiB-like acyl-CoA transferase
LDSALTLVEIPTSYYLATGEEGGESGRPPYKAADGHVVISATGREMAARLFKLVSGGSVEGGPVNSNAGGDRRKMLDDWCATRTKAEICDALMEIGVPVAPVQTIPQVAKDPHLWAREMLVKVDDAVAGEMYVPGVAMKLSATPGRVNHVPTPGEHTDALLGDILGYDAAKLAALRAAKVIG